MIKGFKPCLEMLSGNDPSVGDYYEYVRFFREHPYYMISQKTNEYFHTGMLAWMISRYPIFARAFFPTYNIENHDRSQIKVEIEKEHRDITIIVDNIYYYVIENKVKNFYKASQLKAYSKAIKDKPYIDTEYGYQEKPQMISGVVLGVLRDSHLKRPKQWIYISYNTLLAELKKIYEELKATYPAFETSFDASLIYEYLRFLDALLSVISPLTENFGDTIWGANNVVLKRCKNDDLYDFYRRMMVNSLAEYYRSEYADDTGEYNKLTIDTPYRHQSATVCTVFKVQSYVNIGDRPISVSIEVHNDTIIRKLDYEGMTIDIGKALIPLIGKQQLKEKYKYIYLQTLKIKKKRFDSLASQIHEEVSLAVKIIDVIMKELCVKPIRNPRNVIEYRS